MMRLLHTADWHLGKRLDQFSRLPEQRAVMQEIIEVAEREAVDAVLIAGDIFDHYQPGNDADTLFYQTVHRLTGQGRRPVIVIAGNHDSPEHLIAARQLARESGILLIGLPDQEVVAGSAETNWSIGQTAPGFVEILLPDQPPLRVLTTPYANGIRMRAALDPESPESKLPDLLREGWQSLADRYCDKAGLNIFVGHLFFSQTASEQQVEPDDEKPILYVGGLPAMTPDSLPSQIQYAALGHLHRPHCVDRQAPVPVIYSGSPLSYSFAEANQQKSVTLIDLQVDQPVEWEHLPLSQGFPLLRFRTNDPDEAVQFLQAHQEAYIELTMVVPEFLSSALKVRLENAHPRLFILPESEQLIEETEDQRFHMDLDDLEAVFTAFFHHRMGQVPDAHMLDLFREVINNPDDQ